MDYLTTKETICIKVLNECTAKYKMSTHYIVHPHTRKEYREASSKREQENTSEIKEKQRRDRARLWLAMTPPPSTPLITTTSTSISTSAAPTILLSSNFSFISFPFTLLERVPLYRFLIFLSISFINYFLFARSYKSFHFFLF